jgi:hypothetical protein
MKIPRTMSVLAFLMAGTLIAQDAKVTPLMSKDLADFPGKEGLMITVVYPPGASDPVHRHNAYAFLYVLEGSILMQLKGGNEITLTPGQSPRPFGVSDHAARMEDRRCQWRPNRRRRGGRACGHRGLSAPYSAHGGCNGSSGRSFHHRPSLERSAIAGLRICIRAGVAGKAEAAFSPLY